MPRADATSRPQRRRALACVIAGLSAPPLVWANTVTRAGQPHALGLARPASWQRRAIPYYQQDHVLVGLYTYSALPWAQALESASHQLVHSLAGPFTPDHLLASRQAWRQTLAAWEALTAVAVGPVLTRRSLRLLDFQPTRPALIRQAITQNPQPTEGELARIGAPAKGLPALEWLLWQYPLNDDQAARHYAQAVAQDLALEARALAQDYATWAQTDWVNQPERTEHAWGEFINQWLGGLERLRWQQLEKPLRTATHTIQPAYPRHLSRSCALAWAQTWRTLRQLGVWNSNEAPAAPGAGQVPLEGVLRGRGLNPLADQLVSTLGRVDQAMTALAAAPYPPPKVMVMNASRQLAHVQALVQTELAPALQVSLGFSDADGD